MITSQIVCDEMREDVIEAGGGRHIGETYQTMLHRAARRFQSAGLHISYHRAWCYFYRRVKRPPADEFLNVEEFAKSRSAKQNQQKSEEHRPCA